MKFNIKSKYKPTGDQPKSIEFLVKHIKAKDKFQTLLGATGTGKTFTVANVVEKINKPTLVISHNKTLASQLYAELKSYFPDNRVEYFISYFDYYQPEAYLPGKDVYIEKQTVRNWEIEMMRISTLDALLKRKDVIVVATVAAIYGARNPKEYSKFQEVLKLGDKIERRKFLHSLVRMGYRRSSGEMMPGDFIVKGDILTIVPAWTNDLVYQIDIGFDVIEEIRELEPISLKYRKNHKIIIITPANASVVSDDIIKNGIVAIEKDLKARVKYFEKNNQLLEAQRLEQRTKFDIEQLNEFGFTSGIENYSYYFEPDRKKGMPPFTLFDYFPKDYLLVVDESHITLPQIIGMYEGDKSRKTSLVDYGFRLPTALENRPLKFNEFEDKINQAIFVSATPAEYEFEHSKKNVVEQIIRPTGLLDPLIEVRNTKNQIDDVIEEINKNIKKKQRTFINTITKKLAEDITKYLSEKGIKTAYLHSDLKTFERNEVIRKLRLGIFDVVVGINLLREGLDVPEASLMLILDANKEGYLRNTTSLIQIIGRVARNSEGRVIMYSDNMTKSMKEAIEETQRRREIQIEYNKKHKITPKTIQKPISNIAFSNKLDIDIKFVSDKQIENKIKELEDKMAEASKKYDFETAIELRDTILELKTKAKHR